MVQITDVNRSLRTGVLTLTVEELEDINKCLDIWITRQNEIISASTLDGGEVDEIEQGKLDRFTALKADLVEGEQKIIVNQVFDMVNSVNMCLSMMERTGEDDIEQEKFDRLELLLGDLQAVKQEMEKPVPSKPYGSYK